eukprot:4863252-Pleurochrysis_carterae.AAC.1
MRFTSRAGEASDPDGYKARIPEANPDAGELAEVVQGACRHVLSSPERSVMCSVNADEVTALHFKPSSIDFGQEWAATPPTSLPQRRTP